LLGNLLKELLVERRFGVWVQLWLEIHQPKHTILDWHSEARYLR
jgi:hypothetical protein